MFMTDFSANPLWVNAAVFCIAAAAVWWAGSRLTPYADAISEMTGLGSALTGMLLLGGITSLPEIAVSVTASAAGSAALSVNNILGGIAMQVVIIAIGDAALRRAAITSRIATPTVLLGRVFLFPARPGDCWDFGRRCIGPGGGAVEQRNHALRRAAPVADLALQRQ